MMNTDNYFTLYLDIENPEFSQFRKFFDEFCRALSFSNIKIRLASHGAKMNGGMPKVLRGQYVETIEDLRKQWANLENVKVLTAIKGLDAILTKIYEAYSFDKKAKNILIVVSPICRLKVHQTSPVLEKIKARGIGVLFVTPDKVNIAIQSVNGSQHNFPFYLKNINSKDFSAFNDCVVRGLLQYKNKIDVSHFLISKNKGGCGWSSTEVQELYFEVLWNNPLLFNVNKEISMMTYYNSLTNEIESGYLEINKYIIPQSEYQIRRQMVEEAGRIAVQRTFGKTREVDKIKQLHDYLSSKCRYNDGNNDGNPMKYRTVYDALVCGEVVCEGYTVAFKYLLSLIGIESRKVESDSMNHCWNYVRIGKNWYHVDVTFDNPIMSMSIFGSTSLKTHEFFLLSDAALIKKGEHYGWDQSNLPPATDTQFDRIFWL